MGYKWLFSGIIQQPLLINNIRETDKASRWGEEEFLILLPQTGLHQGGLIAEKLRRIIENQVIAVENQGIFMTASFGVVSLHPDQDNSFDAVYKNADETLYLAKKMGRNRVVLTPGYN